MATAAVERSVVEKFLRNSIEAFQSDATRAKLKSPSSGKPGEALVEIQSGLWQDLGISVEQGRTAVRQIEKLFPDDQAALLALRDEFSTAADAAYLRCLEDRRPAELKTTGSMTKNVLLEFCDACNVKMDTPPVQEKLKATIAETGALPESVLNDVHGEVMEILGFERNYGQQCFKDIGASGEFAQDATVASSVARWRGTMMNVCLRLLHEHRKRGGELHVEEEILHKLLEIQAKEELDAMTVEERSQLLEKNAKKVNVFRGLPAEGRKRYLERLSEGEKLELAKSEILMVTLMQSQQAGSKGKAEE